MAHESKTREQSQLEGAGRLTETEKQGIVDQYQREILQLQDSLNAEIARLRAELEEREQQVEALRAEAEEKEAAFWDSKAEGMDDEPGDQVQVPLNQRQVEVSLNRRLGKFEASQGSLGFEEQIDLEQMRVRLEKV